MDDVPLARQEAQFAAELGVRVVGLLGLLLGGLGGGLGLFGRVDVEGVVDHGVGLGIGGLGHRVEHRFEVDVVALIVDEVHRTLLGGLHGVFVVLERRALLGLVVFRRLLSSRRPVDVIALVLCHF